MATAGTNIQAAHNEDLKILVDTLAWANDTAETSGANPRHTNTQASEFGGSLLPLWKYRPYLDTNGNAPQYPDFPADSTGADIVPDLPAAIFGNISYVVDRKGVLHAFDVNPTEDLDNDGNPDDGINAVDGETAYPGFSGFPYNNDLSRGLSYDELWSVQVPDVGSVNYGFLPHTSAPLVATIPQPGGAPPITCVFVERADGELFGVIASVTGGGLSPVIYPGDGVKFQFGVGTTAGIYTVTQAADPGGIVPILHPIPQPTLYRGRIFAVQADSTLLVIDPSKPNAAGSNPYNNFYVVLPQGPAGNTVGTPTICSLASLDGTYGGDDVVCYVPTATSVFSLLMGSRDEQAQRFLANGSTGLYQMRTKLTAWSSNSPSAAYYMVPAPEDRDFRYATVFDRYVYVNNAGGCPDYTQYVVAAPVTDPEGREAGGYNPGLGQYGGIGVSTSSGGSATSTRARHRSLSTTTSRWPTVSAVRDCSVLS